MYGYIVLTMFTLAASGVVVGWVLRGLVDEHRYLDRFGLEVVRKDRSHLTVMLDRPRPFDYERDDEWIVDSSKIVDGDITTSQLGPGIVVCDNSFPSHDPDDAA